MSRHHCLFQFQHVTFLTIVLCTSTPLKAKDLAAIEFFEKSIRPIFAEHCHECHFGSERKGGLTIDSQVSLLKGGDLGAAIEIGNADKSLLVQAIRYSGDLQMPPDSKLSAHEISLIEKWINAGAVWPKSNRAISESSSNSKSQPDKKLWSLKPVESPRIPKTRNKNWATNRIDQFVLAKLEQNSMSPAARADRATLIRRIYLDVLGIPPTMEQWNSFINDSRPDPIAYESVVDHVLADPKFGEKWARHWLDVVRYSETNGHVQDTVRENAWRYRDYVIDAWNDDIAYDQFIVEHLAGDLLNTKRPGRKGEQNIIPAATGYLWFHEMHFKPLDPNAQRADQVDSQIDVTMKAFQGLTVSCARCHDHKFDPVTQKDYYALAGFFHSTIENQVWLTDVRDVVHSDEAKENFQKLEKLKQDGIRKALQDSRKKTDRLPPFGETMFDPGVKARLREVRQEFAQLDSRATHWAPAATDGELIDARIHIRGSHKNLGESVPRRFLGQLRFDLQSAGGSSDSYANSGRLYLAQQIASSQNPLTARVQVNRLWQHLFGFGIVRTPSDFGMQGDPPSHPLLLDYLATRLIELNWSNKALLKEILQSQTYQMSSDVSAHSQSMDPENRLLQHQNRKRMTAETLRDSILLMAGGINLQMHGVGVAPYLSKNVTANKRTHIPKSGPVDGNGRRSIYVTVRRNFQTPFLTTFDFPDPGASVGKRDVTLSPTQALAMMNSPFVHQMINTWALNFQKERQNEISRVYVQILGRLPSSKECESINRFVHLQDASTTVWKDVIHTLLCSNEFLFIH